MDEYGKSVVDEHLAHIYERCRSKVFKTDF